MLGTRCSPIKRIETNLVGIARVAAPPETRVERTRRGAGFGRPEQNKLVDRAARGKRQAKTWSKAPCLQIVCHSSKLLSSRGGEHEPLALAASTPHFDMMQWPQTHCLSGDHVSLLEISAGNVSGPRPVIRSHLSQRKEAGVGAESPMRNEGYCYPSTG